MPLAWAAVPPLPSLCAVCHGWGPSRVCPACLARFAEPAPRCTRCALRVPPGVATCGACLVAPSPLDGAVAAVDYAFPWDHLLLAFKFHAALDLAPALAARLRAATQANGPAAPELVLPVPQSPDRLRERGFNQAWELARRLGPPADAHTLLRVRHTPHQLALPEAQRAANVRGAFAVEPSRRHRLAGRHVAVVDDVMTTGATGREVARVLLEAGAASVCWWAVARTPRPSD
ncbi:MAG: ComF family protein [Rhizobacter sp.]